MTSMFSKFLLAGCAMSLALPAAAQNRDLNVSTVNSAGASQVTVEIWVDNWFQMFVNGEKIAEDSTSYDTERSFNAERITFGADLPMTVALELRDFIEDDTGLEYIGSRKQQMGDGGAIFQFKDAAGQVMAVSNSDWSCQVIHYAPVQTSCEKASDPQVGVGACAAEISDAPANWTAVDFDDSGWDAATEHAASEVSPKHGYDQVTWDSKAELIWGEDLERDNKILCRAVVGG